MLQKHNIVFRSKEEVDFPSDTIMSAGNYFNLRKIVDSRKDNELFNLLLDRVEEIVKRLYSKGILNPLVKYLSEKSFTKRFYYITLFLHESIEYSMYTDDHFELRIIDVAKELHFLDITPCDF